MERISKGRSRSETVWRREVVVLTFEAARFMALFVLASSSTWSLDVIRLDELAAVNKVSMVYQCEVDTRSSLEADEFLVLCPAVARCSTFFFLPAMMTSTVADGEVRAETTVRIVSVT